MCLGSRGPGFQSFSIVPSGRRRRRASGRHAVGVDESERNVLQLQIATRAATPALIEKTTRTDRG
jgi:hypothetical protein